MDTETIPAAPRRAKTEAGSAYWDGSLACEDLALDAERLSETLYGLACSESYDSNAQSAFYAMGQLAERLQKRAKASEDRLAQLSDKNREG